MAILAAIRTAARTAHASRVAAEGGCAAPGRQLRAGKVKHERAAGFVSARATPGGPPHLHGCPAAAPAPLSGDRNAAPRGDVPAPSADAPIADPFSPPAAGADDIPF